MAAFKDGLQALGYVEGKNIHLELRVPRKPEELTEMAADLANRKVDVIATTGPQPIEAARRATATIPIVIIACDRADRLVNSIARPGGNITGMACISSDLALKRLKLPAILAYSRLEAGVTATPAYPPVSATPSRDAHGTSGRQCSGSR